MAIIKQINKDLEMATNQTLVVITDLRFPNELEVVQVYCSKACYKCHTIFIKRDNNETNYNHSS